MINQDNTLLGRRPNNKVELQAAISECLRLSPDCSDGPHGPMASWDVSAVTHMERLFVDEDHNPVPGADTFKGDLSEWDVSRVTNMGTMFYSASSFNGDISKWDVSRVRAMHSMFLSASSFNGDLSEWDVSSVEDMIDMFYLATGFDGDLSKWDVSSVRDMDEMFAFASSFKQKLCGPAWVRSTASKEGMFEGSAGGLISRKVCPDHTPAATQASSYHATRHPLPERELIARMPSVTSASATSANTNPTVRNAMTCPKCGTFTSSIVRRAKKTAQ